LKKHLRDSGLPADVLLGKLKKDISFALRRGTIAQVITHHHLALDGFAWLRLASRLRLASAPPRMSSPGGVHDHTPMIPLNDLLRRQHGGDSLMS
jgi:hypothetical protein